MWGAQGYQGKLDPKCCQGEAAAFWGKTDLWRCSPELQADFRLEVFLFVSCRGKRGTHLCICFKLICFSLGLGALSMLFCWGTALSRVCALSICERGIELLGESWGSSRCW